MGKSISLATLMSDVRFEFDLDASSSRVSDDQLIRVINRARDELFLHILDCSSSYMDAITQLTTISGVGFVSLPDRFYALTSLRLRVDADRSVVLRAAGPDEVQYDPTTARTWDECSRPIYWVAQNLLHFWPVPSGVYTLDCVYVQGFDDLVSGELWSCMPGWDAWVVKRSLMFLHRRSKEMESYQAAANELDVITAQIESALSGQDRASPPMVRRRSHFLERGPRLSGDAYEWGE